ncbi:MAG TPA: glycosyltransferase family 4 protein [Candidatus Eisenbergiella stercoravium]|nr:glycosyltransferase family 4 protein [Candidatus Eisenbergiella stercoravium]
MRVLIVNKFLYPNGGSETYIFRIGKQLAENGHEVQYFGMEHEGRIVGNRMESYTSSMDFHTGKLGKLLYPFKIIYSLEARRKLRPVLEDFAPDVVHLNNFNFQLTPSILYEIERYEKKSGKQIRIIYTAHDYQLVCPNHLLLRPLEYEPCERCLQNGFQECIRGRCIHGSRIKSILGCMEGTLYKKLHVYRKLDAVICPSRFLRDRLAQYEDLRDKLLVMHNFVDREDLGSEETEHPRSGARKNGLQAGDQGGHAPDGYVLYFGRFCQEKGVKTLLQVCRSLPQIPFVFAGSGPMEEEVNAVKNVENRGFVSGEMLYRLIAEAAFCVVPSEWYENCPFSVMESQIYGTPVLASAIGGIPELVKNGETGELFTPGNVDELREKTERLWKDRERLGRYTENCRSVRFDTTEEYCEKLMEVYKNGRAAAEE